MEFTSPHHPVALVSSSSSSSSKFVAFVHERTIRTERPPFVGEVSVNFLLIKGDAWSVWRIPKAVI
jgi:hypothetical protein